MMNGVLLDNSMSSLASASNNNNEGSKSSNKDRNEENGGGSDAAQPAKKKRNLPGNPDPEGEIIALSPRTLLATNRFVCEICHKGFQREQNLQLHRRGHNLPWKLKQRTNKEVKKKFYVCPEPTCVHHDPSRALGDLTGVKKHYCRKHGEKKWKCEKCSKRYAVQSDWKAHSKVCGTREYRCDCGTVFSRRDSFITHRAFCDALAQESARAITPSSLLSTQPGTSSSSLFSFQTQLHSQGLQALQLKREQDQLQQSFNIRPEMPPWLVGPPPNDLSPHLLITSRLEQPVVMPQHDNHHHHHHNPNPNPTFSSFQPTKASPHMSATGLLQKAAEMGVTMSKPCQTEASFRPHQAHMSAPEFNPTSLASSTGGSALGLSSREEIGTGLIHGLASFMSKAVTSVGLEQQISSSNVDVGASSLLSDTITNGFERSAFEETFNQMMNPKNTDSNFRHHEQAITQSAGPHLSRSGSGNDALTRDFLGLTAFPHRDFLNMAGLDHHIGSSSYDQQNQNQAPWQS